MTEATPPAAPSELRPLTVGEILDRSIKILLRHWRTLLVVVLVVVAPAQFVISLVDVSITEGAFTGTSEATPGEEDVAALVGGFFLIIVTSIVSTILATGAAFRAVAEAYLGERPSWRRSLGFALRRLHSLLWLMVVGGIPVFLGLLLCVVPGIWIGVAWSVAIPVLMTEDVRGTKALGRSFGLVRGRWWPTFGALIVGYLLGNIAGSVVGGIFGVSAAFVEGDIAVFLANLVGSTLSTLISTPFVAAVATVLYVDLRVRKEAFDLQLLAQRLGRGPAPAPA